MVQITTGLSLPLDEKRGSRHDDPKDIAVRLKASSTWLDQLEDTAISSSTATYRNQALARHGEAWRLASENAFGKAFGMVPSEALVACVGVDDYRAPYSIPQKRIAPVTDLRPENEDRDAVAVLASFEMAGPMWEYYDEPIPERVGPHERMFQKASLGERPFTVPVMLNGLETVREAGFRELFVTTQAPTGILPEGDPSVPADCAIQTLSLESPAQRQEWLTNTLGASPKQEELKAFIALVGVINEERARISLATGSLAIAARARRDLSNIIADLEG